MIGRWRFWGFNLGFWTLLSLITASSVYLNTDPLTRVEGLPWWPLFTEHLIVWYFWAGVTPFVFWLSTRLPLYARQPVCRTGLYVAVSLACIGLYAVYNIVVIMWSRSVPPSFVDEVAGNVITFRLYIDYLIFWLIVGAAHAVQFYRESRQRERETAALALTNSDLSTQLVQAQVQALRAQLQPHFLFNTLNTVSSLVRQGNKQGAIRMLAGLSSLLRHTMKAPSVQWVTLEEELAFIEHYLAIEATRFEERLRIDVEVDEDVRRALVPNMFMQPLVENALRHGIAPSLEGGCIRIQARAHNDQLLLEVYNEGPSLPERFALEHTSGIGLTNTRERLRKLYGAAHRFTLENVEDRGVSVRIALPLEREPDL